MPVYQFTYQEFNHEDQLPGDFAALLQHAREATRNSYAPYSHFNVGAAVLLSNGEIIHGVNIENASYPVGVCAERSALASAISLHPDLSIRGIAISYQSETGHNDTPAFPCGMCRQFISECEDRNKQPIPLILSAQHGKIILLNSVKDILPFSFGGGDLA